MSLITTTFYSTKDGGSMWVQLDTEKAKLSMRSQGTCVLEGEDLGKYLAWLKENDYKLPGQL